MSASLTFDTNDFNQQLSKLQEKSGRAASSMVTFWGRKLLRKLSFNTPIASGVWRHKGRARAGWWAAAEGLGVTNIYTPHPNIGEGSFIDARSSVDNPSITLINSVPYITRLKVGMTPFDSAAISVEGQMQRELEKEYRVVLG